jgi:two-component system, LytTR family, response regulator
MSIRAYVLDDEPLAVKRLSRMLAATGKVTLLGSSSDPEEAISQIEALRPEVLFLDIEMPGMNGFAVVSQLTVQPLVVFTTAYDQYALRAFAVNSVDYLLKPVEAAGLDRALAKLERVRGGQESAPDLQRIIAALTKPVVTTYPTRLPSRTGEKVEFVDLARVTHFYSEDKLTFAATAGKAFVVESSIIELEAKLDPEKWFRIHRSTLVQLDYVQELHGWIGNRLLIRLKDDKKTELTVARERVAELKAKLGL